MEKAARKGDGSLDPPGLSSRPRAYGKAVTIQLSLRSGLNDGTNAVERSTAREEYQHSKLSRMSDISFSTISRIINDKNYSPTLTTLERIARALDISISDLSEETEK